ncbi:unnamed protein product [Adineta ricciae]|uniref:Transmembrane protein n=1 Tax=Adineta ricciae TaxID=249248 RepID=A0A813P5U7_ADIRI|nr:unnamed protein product [Adineta ricciae]
MAKTKTEGTTSVSEMMRFYGGLFSVAIFVGVVFVLSSNSTLCCALRTQNHPQTHVREQINFVTKRNGSEREAQIELHRKFCPQWRCCCRFENSSCTH